MRKTIHIINVWKNNNFNSTYTYTKSSLIVKDKPLEFQPLCTSSLLPPSHPHAKSLSDVLYRGEKTQHQVRYWLCFSVRKGPYVLKTEKNSRCWGIHAGLQAPPCRSALHWHRTVSSPFCRTICQALGSAVLQSKLSVIYSGAQCLRSYLEVR